MGAFNLKTKDTIFSFAKIKGQQIRSHRIIYDLIEDVRNIMECKLPPVVEATFLGSAEVRAIFGGGKAGKVAGCVVTRGCVYRLKTCKIIRKNQVIFNTKFNSLRRNTDQVDVVDAGTECGIDVDGFKDWELGDLIQCYETTERQPTLEEANVNI